MCPDTSAVVHAYQTDFLSANPLSKDILERLRQDLDDAEIIRFAVAYISQPAIDALDLQRLASLLCHEHSFGLGSLTCDFGYKPLYALQSALTVNDPPRLKYFLEPYTADEPRLLHDKLIYLASPSRGKSVLYVGSHNWTGAALGITNPYNIEASLRIELPFERSDLDGDGSGLAAMANAHLMKCYEYPVAMPVTPENRLVFQCWYEAACTRLPSDPPPPLDPVRIVLAACSVPELGSTTAETWMALKGKSLFIQCHDEEDGQEFRKTRNTFLMLAWASEEGLRRRQQPVVLICRETTSYAGPDSSEKGSNEADNISTGFKGVLCDHEQHASCKAGPWAQPRRSVWTERGLKVEYFDFDMVVERTSASEVNEGIEPLYQFHLEVDEVILPRDRFPDLRGYPVWDRGTLAMAQKRTKGMHRDSGYIVSESDAARILRCLRDDFGVDFDKAKALPRSLQADPRVGLRIATHPVNHTFLPLPAAQRAAAARSREQGVESDDGSKYYSSVPRGFIAAEWAPPGRTHLVRRVSQASVVCLKELVERWTT